MSKFGSVIEGWNNVELSWKSSFETSRCWQGNYERDKYNNVEFGSGRAAHCHLKNLLAEIATSAHVRPVGKLQGWSCLLDYSPKLLPQGA